MTSNPPKLKTTFMKRNRNLRVLEFLAAFLLFRNRRAGAEPATTLAELQTRLADHVCSRVYKPRRGLKVASLDTGKTVFEHNAQKLFSPASNSKLTGSRWHWTVGSGLPGSKKFLLLVTWTMIKCQRDRVKFGVGGGTDNFCALCSTRFAVSGSTFTPSRGCKTRLHHVIGQPRLEFGQASWRVLLQRGGCANNKKAARNQALEGSIFSS